MALPAGITTATVTFGATTDFLGNPVTTKLKIVPSATIFWAGTNAPVVAFAITAESDVEGSVVLPHTDQPGFVDINGQPILHWSYIATGEWKSAAGSASFSKEFLLPSTATVIDFDTMAGGAIGTTNPPSTVGPPGPPGPSGASAGSVKYDQPQSLTAPQKTQAQMNIGLNTALADMNDSINMVGIKGSNLVLDPNFEVDAMWAGQPGTPSATQKHSGAKSRLMTAPTFLFLAVTRTGVQSYIKCKPGEVFYCEAWFQPNGANTGLGKLSIYGLCQDSLGVNGETYPLAQSLTVTAPMKGNWQKLSGYITIPAGRDRFIPYIPVEDAADGDSFYIDDLTVREVTEAYRKAPRLTSVVNTASWTINADVTDFAENSGLTGPVTIQNPTGTPTQGQRLVIAITGTAARAITWGTAFEASTIALPATTTGTATLDIGFRYNTASAKWRVTSVA